MKIYGVYVGSDYEVGSVHSPMFKLESDALMECNATARIYNENNGCCYELMANKKEWRDGYDYITVIEYEVI